MAQTIFHLIRHGDHDLIGRFIAGRAPGVFLNAHGRAQAEAIAISLGHRPLAAIVASPLERTQETAAPLARRTGQTVRVDKDLVDIDFGEWTMIPFDRLHRDPRWLVFNSFRSAAPIPGGETMLAVQGRTVRAVLRLHREFAAGEIAVFSHGDVIKSILMHFLGIGLDFVHRIETSPGSRSVLALDEYGAKLLALNLPAGAQEAS